MTHQIIVGNIGTVYDGNDRKKAEETFDGYCRLSQDGYGRAAYETVTWMRNGEIFKEFTGTSGDKQWFGF